MAMPGTTVFVPEDMRFMEKTTLATRDRETGFIVYFPLNEEEFRLATTGKDADWNKMADLLFERLEIFQSGHKHLVGNYDLLWLNGRPVH